MFLTLLGILMAIWAVSLFGLGFMAVRVEEYVVSWWFALFTAGFGCLSALALGVI